MFTYSLQGTHGFPEGQLHRLKNWKFCQFYGKHTRGFSENRDLIPSAGERREYLIMNININLGNTARAIQQIYFKVSLTHFESPCMLFHTV